MILATDLRAAPGRVTSHGWNSSTSYFLWGKREGKLEGIQEMIAKLCRSFGIELTAEREAQLAQMSRPTLDQLADHLLAHHTWP